ncbi:di-heme oxidoredictase family protein [Saccharospirillum impatiens]|uniref:di-heme oxidoreductase family protein n=1 Tax=Saccharospirillum impatiens TaxID=169438 RepID=UPI00068465F7|nr:di-heme oxidoredictase family protein [Saccharospirillum impatiens]
MASDSPLQTNADSGGDGSVAQFDHNAFSLPNAAMSMTRRLDFSVGNSFFRNPWVQAPASTDARDGLGPLFNTNSCQGCHIKDGRGHPPAPGDAPISLFLRLSIPADPATDQDGLITQGVIPDPVYGGQLQTASLPGLSPEADLSITHSEKTVTLRDGTRVTLMQPHYHIDNLAYGDLPDNLMTSPRVAPPMIGLGLLAAIPESRLRELADPDDRDQNGVSGRLNRVWDRASQSTQIGRFGWKAGEPSVLQQSMGAFAGDMGLTSALFPNTDCTPSQGCLGFIDGGAPEVSDNIAGFIEFYASSLAVPKRRSMDDPAVQRGAQRFNDAGCAACHTPNHQTAHIDQRPELSNQSIWPYSDLLLHDMGPELADNRPEFLATGQEWRTPPLWGIGLAQQVNPLAGFLHDGRARTLEEAILWHGGEAETSRDTYSSWPSSDRSDLIRFLESL